MSVALAAKSKLTIKAQTNSRTGRPYHGRSNRVLGNCDFLRFCLPAVRREPRDDWDGRIYAGFICGVIDWAARTFHRGGRGHETFWCVEWRAFEKTATNEVRGGPSGRRRGSSGGCGGGAALRVGDLARSRELSPAEEIQFPRGGGQHARVLRLHHRGSPGAAGVFVPRHGDQSDRRGYWQRGGHHGGLAADLRGGGCRGVWPGVHHRWSARKSDHLRLKNAESDGRSEGGQRRRQRSL